MIILILKVIGVYIFLGLWYSVLDSRLINLYIQNSISSLIGVDEDIKILYYKTQTFGLKFITTRHVIGVIFFPIILVIVYYHLLKLRKKK